MDDFEIYDTVEAGTLEDGDQILWQDDILDSLIVENIDRDYVIVRGYSHVTGDHERYEIPVECAVDLWSV